MLSVGCAHRTDDEEQAVRVAVTGSIATDHLMTFPGRFADVLVTEQLQNLSVSLLVDGLEVRRGGVGANIAFGLASLGLRPVLVGAAGTDFADYRSWLDRAGVDTSHVHVSELSHTARFVCTTDADQNQFASFYPGAMSEARDIELGPVCASIAADGADPVGMVLIGPDDPEAMRRHTDECKRAGIPFVADPSQQLSSMDDDTCRQLIDGAAYLFTNEYEAALTEKRTGWTADEVLARVGTRVTTLGARGAKVERAGEPTVEISVPQEERKADPTGVGDAFRAGYLAGLTWGLGPERCAQVGATLATYVIETVGTQEYVLGQQHFLDRFAGCYGADAAAEVGEHLRCARP
jgi:adenosine kinase